jgi:hypothetical protein
MAPHSRTWRFYFFIIFPKRQWHRWGILQRCERYREANLTDVNDTSKAVHYRCQWHQRNNHVQIQNWLTVSMTITMISNLSDSETFWYWTCLVLKPIWYRTLLIPNMSDPEPIWYRTHLIFWTLLIPDLSGTNLNRCKTYLIPNLSDNGHKVP